MNRGKINFGCRVLNITDANVTPDEECVKDAADLARTRTPEPGLQRRTQHDAGSATRQTLFGHFQLLSGERPTFQKRNAARPEARQQSHSLGVHELHVG